MKYGLPQWIYFYAYDPTTNLPVDGDEANISMAYSTDGADSLTAFVNAPVSLGNGLYTLELTVAERFGTVMGISGSSTTPNVVINAEQVVSNLSVVVGGPIRLSNNVVAIYRGDTWLYYTVLETDISGSTDVSFALKRDTSDLNADALIYITESAGLEAINGLDPTSASNGSLSIIDGESGTIRITLAAEESKKLPSINGGLWADIQVTTETAAYTPKKFPMCIIADVVTS